jgi:hypothetical protein
VKFYKLGLTVLLVASLSGCFLTKIVTVPMRIVGAVVSVVPVIGNSVDESIEAVADAVDDVPL